MNIFFDTNIILELLADRSEAEHVAEVIELCAKYDWKKFISVGSLYTLAYMTERILHQQGITKPELTQKQRIIFHDLLETFEIAPLDSVGIEDSVDNLAFADMEDSFQYQSALQAECDFLITINIKDFKRADQKKIKIMEPVSFIKEFMNNNQEN